MIITWRWLTLTLAAGLFVLRLLLFNLISPSYLIAIEASMWIFTLFGFGFKHLNQPGKAVVYLSQAAYPVYILHMVFLYLGSSWIMPLDIPGIFQFMLILVITILGSTISYEILIKRVSILRVLFGLKVK